MYRKIISAMFLFSLLVLGSQAQAHRLKTVLTTIELNANTGMLEVVHRSYAHDVEHTLGGSLRNSGGLESIEGQARVAVELSESFTLWGEGGATINLVLVGAELENEFFYIYQEVPMTEMPGSFQIRNELLLDYWPDMTNYVNVQFKGGVQTLIFSNKNGIQEINSLGAE